jgi:hypothetical protein
MAKYIASAPANGFTVEQVTQEQRYLADVARYLATAASDPANLGSAAMRR